MVNRSVGTTMKSIDTISLAWFVKKLRHVWLGGLEIRRMYSSTVDFATTIPSFASSLIIFGEPHVGFMVDIMGISSWISLDVVGRLARLGDRVEYSAL